MTRITGPLFKHFGSKWSAARYYPAPLYGTIYEPFAGSAGYSLRHHEHNVILRENNVHLQSLWWWLIAEASESLIREIPLDIPVGTDIRALGLTHGQELLLKHWQRTNNVGNCWTISPWGNKPGQWTANTRARVAEEHQAVKHWRIFGPDADWSAPNTTYFCDSPYLYNYRYGADDFDFAALARALHSKQKPRQLIVCEAVCPKTQRVPDWMPFTPFRETVTSRRKAHNSHHSKELLFHECGVQP